MIGNHLILRHMVFSGPKGETAGVTFNMGLNVIYGASETGKSFLLEAIDFMLGSSKPLRDIPERIGYDTIFLGMEESNGALFTLERATAGGKFRYHEGLHTARPQNGIAKTLGHKHNPTNSENLSVFLLKKIGLFGNRVCRNARGETNSLSFRNLAHLCLISEVEIQKKESPVETGQYTSRTVERSIFKLLLTGIDDSAVEPEEETPGKQQSRTAKIEIIDDIIADYRDRLAGLIGEDNNEGDLFEQLQKLVHTLEQKEGALNQSEEQYRELVSRRNTTRLELERESERRGEISELLSRFRLLERHYQSDLVRLEGIHESGTLVSVLNANKCPLCGAKPNEQHTESDCDGNVEAIVQAADAEAGKIKRLLEELKDTVVQLNLDVQTNETFTKKLNAQLEIDRGKLQEINPELETHKSAFADLLNRKSSVEAALRVLTSISELEERRTELESSPDRRHSEKEPLSELPLKTLNSFSNVYEDVLKSWNFPETDRVYFDKPSFDFIISSKHRGARGKGMRALSYAAFTVSLLKFTKLNNLPHPGFSILDTPLLAYREPEGEDDDLRGTDVHLHFYEQLHAISDRQLIVLENVDPPKAIQESGQCTFFSKNPQLGRSGFFPDLEK